MKPLNMFIDCLVFDKDCLSLAGATNFFFFFLISHFNYSLQRKKRLSNQRLPLHSFLFLIIARKGTRVRLTLTLLYVNKEEAGDDGGRVKAGGKRSTH